MIFSGKVAIMPCTGVGGVLGTIARQAAYRVCEDERPPARRCSSVCAPVIGAIAAAYAYKLVRRAGTEAQAPLREQGDD